MRRLIAPETFLYEVEAPLVARARQAGQFMIVTPTPTSERIPLSIAGGDREAGTIRFAVMRVGRTTRELCALEEGDHFFSILGPLGEPTEIRDFGGTVACIGGGYGAGAVVPIAEEARRQGNRVVGIIGARDADRLIFADELAAVTDELICVTNDGSRGRQGLVTEVLAGLVESGERVAHVFAVGPVPMMRALAEQTRALGIGCTVSLNALMVDGTGMCGGCRVTVGGRTRFACFDGPDFDAHQVDFDALVGRQGMYKEHELSAHHADDEADLHYQHACRLDQLVDEYHARFEPELPEGVPAEGPLTKRERMRIPRQTMPEQPAADRVLNFGEVELGLTEAQAIVEARRCLDCRQPICIEGCPVNIEIPLFLRRLAEGDIAGAAGVVRASNCLPAVSGRVCPQERQCEGVCVLHKKAESVSIGRLERFVADWEMAHGNMVAPLARPTGNRVAVVGSGPAGLTAAGELARRGHAVTVFEALHKAGGVLVYGIPEFRLPARIVEREVASLEAMGARFVMGALNGRSLTLEELLTREGFDAIFLGPGAGLPRMLGVPGEDLKGSYTANEFLTRVNLMRADEFPKYATPVMVGREVIVVGAGNTAMDCARTARRMGSRSVTIVYRRSEAEMPARAEEVRHAREEGIRFEFLAAPVEILGDEQGFIRRVRCVRMALGEEGRDGRRSPAPVPGSEFELKARTVISALGFGVNPLIPATTPALQVDRRGVFGVDAAMRTSIPGVFAGGDAVTGGATVIQAMGQGKRAAEAIDAWLRGAGEGSDAGGAGCGAVKGKCAGE